MSDFTRYILVDDKNSGKTLSLEMDRDTPVIVGTTSTPGNCVVDFVYPINPAIWEALESYSTLLEAYRKTTKLITELEQEVAGLQESVSAATTVIDSINKIQCSNMTSSLFDENSWVQSEQ